MNFVWCGKKTRIAFTVLSRGKKQGGLAIPDLKKYYNAVALTRVMEWAREVSDKRWVNIENSMSNTQVT